MKRAISIAVAVLALAACGGHHHPTFHPGPVPVLYGWSTNPASFGYVPLHTGDTTYAQVLVGFPEPFHGVRLDVERTDGTRATLLAAYNRGAGDAALPLTDTTGALTFDGDVTWEPPADWTPGLSWSSTLMHGLYVVRLVLEVPVGAQPPAVTILGASIVR